MPQVRPTRNAYLDSIIWGTKWETNSLSYYKYYEYDTPLSYDAAIIDVLSMYAAITPLEFTEIDDYDYAHLGYFPTVRGYEYSGWANPPDVYDDDSYPGDIYLSDRFTKSDYQLGEYGFFTMLHETGHALGLAHPHDKGGESILFPGVLNQYSSGEEGLNDVRYTIMSYRDGYSSIYPITPMAFDIAALQHIYGASDHNEGNNVYDLTAAIGNYYFAVWDTGGIDIITYDGVKDIQVDLRAATLVQGDPYAGGYFSGLASLSRSGGMYIANGVIVENIDSGAGNDKLHGNDHNNAIAAGGGDDVIIGADGDDILNGEGGNDILYGGQGNDRLTGGHGKDILYGENGDDILIGSLGDDTLYGNNGDDILYGRNDNDTLRGGNGHDKLYGEDGIDILDGGQGNDRLMGGQGNDKLYGSMGHDWLYGQMGDDLLHGEGGNDKIYGQDGVDTLYGGKGIDRLYGGVDDDIITGGVNRDWLFGGQGDDIYNYSLGHGNDILRETSGNDKINVNFSQADVAANFSLEQDGNDLVINFTETGNIRVVNHYLADDFAVEELVFTDGVMSLV